MAFAVVKCGISLSGKPSTRLQKAAFRLPKDCCLRLLLWASRGCFDGSRCNVLIHRGLCMAVFFLCYFRAASFLSANKAAMSVVEKSKCKFVSRMSNKVRHLQKDAFVKNILFGVAEFI